MLDGHVLVSRDHDSLYSLAKFSELSQSRHSLEQRGWTLQEQVLSSRSVLFGKDQLHWECRVGNGMSVKVLLTSWNAAQTRVGQRKLHLINLASYCGIPWLSHIISAISPSKTINCQLYQDSLVISTGISRGITSQDYRKRILPEDFSGAGIMQSEVRSHGGHSDGEHLHGHGLLSMGVCNFRCWSI